MEFDLKKATIIIENNLIIVRYKKMAEVEYDDAVEISKIIIENTSPTGFYGLLNNISEMKGMSRETRDYFAAKGNQNNVNAIVINKGLQSMLSKMYFSFSNPVIPTKVFNSEAEAIDWLNEQIKINS